MADEKRRQARELWEQSGGTLPLKEIAEQLGVPESTVRNWKRRDGWDGESATSRSDATRRQRQARTNARIAKAVDQAEALSDAEKEFCLHFVQCYNAAQSAWRTGRYTTYGSAKSAGWSMLQKQAVQEEIRRLKVIKRSAILADADDVVEMHMRIAFASMSDFAQWGYIEGSNRMGVKLSDEVDGAVVTEVSETAQGFKIKRADPQKSLEFLER